MPVLTRRQAQVLRPQYDLTNGLVGWYPCDDALNRSISGYSGQTLTTVTGTPRSAPGIVRDANSRTGSVYFNGSAAYSQSPTITGQPAGSSIFSSSVWLKLDTSPPAANQQFLSWGANTTGWPGSFLYARYSSSKFYIAHEFGSSNGLIIGGTELVSGIWYHVAQVYNGSTNSIYVNGKSDATPVSASSVNVLTTTFVVGGYPSFPTNSPTPALKGWLDDIRIYNRALSPGEVFSLYASAFQPPVVLERPIIALGLYSAIDGPTPDDTDYIKAPTLISGATATYECALAPIANPGTASDHVIQYRIRATGGAKTDCIVKLMCGTTEIASWTHVAVGKQFMTARQVLTSAQAASIADYSNLRLRFTSAPE